MVFGAGFSGLYNTAYRMGRYRLQFSVRNEAHQVTFEELFPQSSDAVAYLLDCDSRIYQCSFYKDQTTRWWNQKAGLWQADNSFGLGEMQSGESKMRVAGNLLQFRGTRSGVIRKKYFQNLKMDTTIISTML